MSAAAFLVVVLLGAGYLASLITKRRIRKKDQMFGYFEYEYNGRRGSSVEYGPMKELDAVGAMNYRQQCGAVITYQKFHTDIDVIHEVIDMRQFMHDKRKERNSNDFY